MKLISLSVCVFTASLFACGGGDPNVKTPPSNTQNSGAAGATSPDTNGAGTGPASGSPGPSTPPSNGGAGSGTTTSGGNSGK